MSNIELIDILRVKRILEIISSDLNTKDYLNFQLINKLVYNTTQEFIEPEIWLKKLQLMGLKYTIDPELFNLNLEDHTDPLNSAFYPDTALDSIINGNSTVYFNKSQGKQIYIALFKCYSPYIDKLYNNDINSSIFPSEYSQDPLKQAKILNGINLFNESNSLSDYSYYMKIKEKWSIFREIFINSVLRELDSDFGNKSIFIEVLLELKEENLCIEYFKSLGDITSEVLKKGNYLETLFTETVTNTDSKDSCRLDQSKLDQFFKDLTNFFNNRIKQCDDLFHDKYPIIVNYSEAVIRDNLTVFTSELFASDNNDRLKYFPKFYTYLIKDCIVKINKTQNGGEEYPNILKSFIHLYFEPIVSKYSEYQVEAFRADITQRLDEFQSNVKNREKEQNEELYNNIKNKHDEKTKKSQQDITESKNNFLTSFTQILNIGHNNNSKREEEQIKMEFDLTKMTNTLQNIKLLVSLDLCMNVLSLAKDDIDNICTFLGFENIKLELKVHCQAIFKIMIDEINEKHIKPAYIRALNLLNEYDPDDTIEKQEPVSVRGQQLTVVEPLVKFTELMNIGDIILQMISIFYKNELVRKKIIDKNKDFLNDVVYKKKSFETLVDDFVADGLNTGINKLISEIEFAFNTLQMADDFNPPKTSFATTPTSTRDLKPTKCAITVVEMLFHHCFLLNGVTDKGTTDVYQQEIGERFFQQVVKNIKKNLISVDGAVYLICDLNYYYDFICYKLKQKQIVKLFTGLKSVGQLFLIDGKDSKELGRMICDVGKFNGIFSQEEVYELIQRRADWYRVKKNVERIMYGLGFGECIIS
ncbi:Rcy1p SCDLUD_004045 [Saccharomycodes ludwigii]|nr:hypothetical protein SCDLUD_004045 [Saccharomycodes ludwigii]KAH3899757.1 hypothetical protein SCDLUD_004045 [Saccharomycodes ludwigii]